MATTCPRSCSSSTFCLATMSPSWTPTQTPIENFTSWNKASMSDGELAGVLEVVKFSKTRAECTKTQAPTPALFSPGSLRIIVIGIAPPSNSSNAISIGSPTPSGTSTKTGAPIAIWRALAPTIRAFSYRVYFLGKMGWPPTFPACHPFLRWVPSPFPLSRASLRR